MINDDYMLSGLIRADEVTDYSFGVVISYKMVLYTKVHSTMRVWSKRVRVSLCGAHPPLK